MWIRIRTDPHYGRSPGSGEDENSPKKRQKVPKTERRKKLNNLYLNFRFIFQQIKYYKNN